MKNYNDTIGNRTRDNQLRHRIPHSMDVFTWCVRIQDHKRYALFVQWTFVGSDIPGEPSFLDHCVKRAFLQNISEGVNSNETFSGRAIINSNLVKKRKRAEYQYLSNIFSPEHQKTGCSLLCNYRHSWHCCSFPGG